MQRAEPGGCDATVRRAGADEAALIAQIGRRTFREAFASDNDPADLAAYLAEAFSIEAIGAEIGCADNRFFVARSAASGEVLGYAKVRRRVAAPPGVEGASPVEIHRLYAVAHAIGRGVGAALMRACLAEARAGGHDVVWLGVWEHNPRAIAFYRRWGFSRVGAHTFRLGSDEQIDWIMALALPPTEATRGREGGLGMG